MADKPVARGGGKPEGKPMGPKKPAPVASGSKISLTEVIIAVVILLLLLFVFGLFSSAGSGIGAFLSSVLSVVKTLSTVISMTALIIVIYSYIRIQEINAEETKKLGLALNWETEKTQKNARWQRVEEYMTSLNSSDWKVAILEADNILDDIIERMGYKGASLGERMKDISATDFPYLEEAWEAHKIRNALAHKGTDYALTRSDAEHVINIYHRIFSGLGYL